ncbi:MAG: hypothetical protein A2W00_04450 [Candidatus Eisenbacteria bacterium RBG_16_71_46]|nr:MAG: hypothetical protein A2V59_06825 [Armatimonadetes bacterium RBG_19FT_COMBO_69_19]OGF05202.1 MAG: hypothetical protein A2W00_04450 [Candidatus Eisenbacteria bacterium RBG_16_71_46]
MPVYMIGEKVRLAGHAGTVRGIEGDCVLVETESAEVVRVLVQPAPRLVEAVESIPAAFGCAEAEAAAPFAPAQDKMKRGPRGRK